LIVNNASSLQKLRHYNKIYIGNYACIYSQKMMILSNTKRME